jgi:ribosome-binding factor A
MPDPRRGRHRVGERRYPRTARVNAVIQEVVADAIERAGTDDERLQLLTVTGVETDPDLRHATVFYSGRHAEAEVALAERRVRLQAAVARETRLKRTPQLSFVVDPALTSGWRVEEIIRGLKREHEQGEHGDDPTG